MEKTLREIIEILKSQGNEVEFRERKDGGFIITKINGQKFSGAQGNTKARHMTGSSLSQARFEQLNRINAPIKGKTPSKRKKAPIEESIDKKLRRVQRLWRKFQTQADKGRITKPRIRWIIEHKGKQAAMETLEKAEAYARGYAYEENVQHLIDRLIEYTNKGHIDDFTDDQVEKLDNIISILESRKSTLRDETLMKIYHIFYDLDEDRIELNDAINAILALL